MTSRAARKDNQRKLNNYKPSHYTKSLQIYHKFTLKKIDTLIRSISYDCPYSSKFPVYKLLRAICKMFLLGQFETLVFAVFIYKTGWKINLPCILRGSYNMGQVLRCIELSVEYQQLTLYLMLVGWAAKTVLNQNISEIADQAKRICNNFLNIFLEWVESYDQILMLSPSTLNRLYYMLTNPASLIRIDYQVIVDAILEISFAYNPEKDQKIKNKKPSVALQDSLPCKIQPWSGKRQICNINAYFENPKLNQIYQDQHNDLKVQESINVFGNIDLTRSLPFAGSFENGFGNVSIMPSINGLKQNTQSKYYEVKLDQCCNDLVVFSLAQNSITGFLHMQKGVSISQKSKFKKTQTQNREQQDSDQQII